MSRTTNTQRFMVYKAFAPAIVGMSGQIHADFLWLLWVLADKQMRSYHEFMGKQDKIRNHASQWVRAKASTLTRLPLVGPLLLAAPPVVICLCTVLHYLVWIQVMTPVEVVLGQVLLRMVHAVADPVSRVQRTFPRGGVPVSAPSLAVSAGRGFDDAHLNAFLAAAFLRVIRYAVPVQAPVSASVFLSAAVRGFDTDVPGSVDASSVGHPAACRVVVNISAVATRSSASGAAVCQVVNPGSSGVVTVLSSLVEGATVSPTALDMFSVVGTVPIPLNFHHPSPPDIWGA